jgi:sulfatase maturation enzyme AslB (radical SAM superfamily)
VQALKQEEPDPDAPAMPLDTLDDLWFQVTGTLCNLECNHCFNNSGPNNRTFDMMDPATIESYLEESRDHAVKEYYFTGGEPFLHPDMIDILDTTLDYGPATVLTNATAFTEEELDGLAELFHGSRYSLEVRVSIDGFTPETNDPIRGEGTFEEAMDGVEGLVERGLLPIITATRTWEIDEDAEILGGFRETLADIGYDTPRIKLLPSLKIGREEDRDRGYHATEKVTHEMMKDVDNEQFLCSNSRLVTDRGIWACPILVLHAEAKVGETLEEALQPISLGFDACYTCYRFGQLCSNMPSGEYSTDSSDKSNPALDRPTRSS